MRNKLWAFLKEHLVSEVPAEMSACLDCDAVQCTQDRFKVCQNRLRHAEALRAMQASGSGNDLEDPA